MDVNLSEDVAGKLRESVKEAILYLIDVAGGRVQLPNRDRIRVCWDIIDRFVEKK